MVASHSGSVKVEFISSAIFDAVYAFDVSQRIGFEIIDFCVPEPAGSSIVKSVTALSIPPVSVLDESEVVKSPQLY